MKWIRTKNGDKAHIVWPGKMTTLCGIPLEHAVEIVIPGPDDRCDNCDHVWRGKRWRIRPGPTKRDPAVYAHRHHYRDHDE